MLDPEMLKALPFLVLLVLSPNGGVWLQSGVSGPPSRYSGVSCLVEMARGVQLERANLLVYVGAVEGPTTVMVGYAVFPPSWRLVDGKTIYVNETVGVGFYGYVNESNAFELALLPVFLRPGTFNNFTLRLQDGEWVAYINGTAVGALRFNSARPVEDVIVTVQLANTLSSKADFSPISFEDVSVLKNGKWVPLPSGFSHVGTAPWSRPSADPYGVAERGDENASFVVGYGLPNSSGVQLWPLYLIKVKSLQNQTENYLVNGSECELVARGASEGGIKKAFDRWIGGAFGYNGSSNPAYFVVRGSTVEVASYRTYYRVELHFSGVNPTQVSLTRGTVPLVLSVNSTPFSAYLIPGRWSLTAYFGGVRLFTNVSAFALDEPENISIATSLLTVDLTLLDPFHVPLVGVPVLVNSTLGRTNSSGEMLLPVNPGELTLSASYYGASFKWSGKSPLTARLEMSSFELFLVRLPLWISMALTLIKALLGYEGGLGKQR